MISVPQVILVSSSQGERYVLCFFAHKEKREMHTGLSLDGLKEGDILEHLAVNGRTILKYILIEKNWRSWIGFIHLWLGFVGVLMKTVTKVWCIQHAENLLTSCVLINFSRTLFQ